MAIIKIVTTVWLLIFLAFCCTILTSCSTKSSRETGPVSQEDTVIAVQEVVDDGSEGGNDTDYESVYAQWMDGKWIDEKFLDKLHKTRSLDSAMAINPAPLLEFYQLGDETKVMDQHTFYTYLGFEKYICTSPINEFTDGRSAEEYKLILDAGNTCEEIDLIFGKMISPENEDREYLDISFNKFLDGEEVKGLEEVAHHRYRRVSIEVQLLLTNDIMEGDYQDKTGRNYIFTSNVHSKEFLEGVAEDDIKFRCVWNGANTTYALSVDARNMMLLTVTDPQAKTDLTYVVSSYQDAMVLQHIESQEEILLTRTQR